MIKTLIVEDDPMVAELNRRYVEQVEGFSVVATAKNGEAALLVLAKMAVDLVLLDIFMPGINGLELLTTLRKQDATMDVLIVSAACDVQTVKKASQHGAVDYLIKPFTFGRLKNALERYRDREQRLAGGEELNQDELDRHYFVKEQPTQQELLKGLDRNTLRKVWAQVQQIGCQVFTTEELAIQVGISRVSMRKYLEFLLRLQIIRVETTYGTVGRPVYKYQCIDLLGKELNRYL